MTEPAHDLLIRRILVALDASAHSRAALEAAAVLAARLDAELTGLFVTDRAVLRAAALPFTRVIDPLACAPRPFESAGVRREFRVLAERARRMFEAVAARAETSATFRIVEGEVTAELLAAAAEADLLALGQSGHTEASRRKLGATARAVIARVDVPVLVLRRGVRLDRPVLALYDASPAAERALRMAAFLARQDADSPLVVLVTGPDAATIFARQRALIERYGEEPPELHFRPLSDPSPARVAHVAREERAGLLAGPAGAEALRADGLSTLLASTECPILLVR